MWQARSEAELVQDFIDFGLAWLAERNYTLTVDVDMMAWARLLSDVPANPLVNPTFDPRMCQLSPENSFWLDVRVGSQTVATSAARLFVTDDYLSLKKTMKLWYDNPGTELAVSAPRDLPKISGRVGHEGGLWVHPTHRKRGLSAMLPHLNRALCLREWNIAWQTGATNRGITASGLPERAYGFPHVVPCFEGFFPVVQRQERLYITYMNRDELIAGLNLSAVSRLLPDGHNEVADAVVLVQKW
jgi:hypothetical protein